MPEVSKSRVDRHQCRWQLAIPAVVLLFPLGLAVYAYAIRANARAILRDVATLKLGVSSLEDVKALAARHRNHLDRAMNCREQTCSVSFVVPNTWLHRLRLEPEAAFGAQVEVNGGKVDFIHVILARNTRVFPTSNSGGMTDEYLKPPVGLAWT